MARQEREIGKMETKRFSKNDEGFSCRACGRTVEPLGYSSRNHCPYCLASVHLDENPGDRASQCGGLMLAIGAAPDPKKGFVIAHQCQACGAIRRCRAARDDRSSLLIALTAKGMPLR